MVRQEIVQNYPFVIIETEDVLSVYEPYCIIVHKNVPIALKEGNVIVFRSENFSFLDYIIDFLKTFRNRLEILKDPYKPTRIAFKLRTLNNRTYYLGFGRLNFFEYKYLWSRLIQLGIVSANKEQRNLADVIGEDNKEVLEWLY